jgi:hypothetical protein
MVTGLPPGGVAAGVATPLSCKGCPCVPEYGAPDEIAGGEPVAGAAGAMELGGLTQFELDVHAAPEQKVPGPVVGTAVVVTGGTAVGVPGFTGVPGVALGPVVPETVNVTVFVVGAGTPGGGPCVLTDVTSLGMPPTPFTIVPVTV